MAEFLEPGFSVRIVCYDGEKQVARIAAVTAHDQGLLTVEDQDGRTTIYNLRSIGLLSVNETFPDDEDVKRWSRS
jgi:hypothetical protein